ncbi:MULTISPECIES: LuxR C-terminal-related transcriptional regulator [Nocardioides]|uniref:LuxR C-terminal-related transcriptional regulator n=1 Tax=Nocardioides vastitatis TaxID=2568655 RepID=A0ABW0ZHL1_9ACTN|nr:response regulator transcription factor [Nocardioides sp.]
MDDHLLFVEMLELSLTREGHDVRTVAVSDPRVQARHLCSAILRTRPQIVLLDLDLGLQVDGVCFVEPLQRAGVAVIVVTGDEDETRWGECIARGARIVLPKSASLDTILRTVRRVAEGRPVMGPEEADRLLRRYRQELGWVQDVRARLDTLTPREREILAALMSGQNVHDIARAALVSEATVRSQVKSVLAKLHVSSQLAAVGIAHKAHWLEPHSA